MKIIRSFSTIISETIIRERAITFLTQAGYKQKSDSNGYLHLRRGSNIGVLFNFNPQKWTCDVSVRIKSEGNSSEINVAAEISSDPTEKRFAEELITAEISLLEAAVTLNEFKTYDVSALKRRIASHFYRIVGIFAPFMFSVILGIVAALFVYVKFNISLTGAAAIGAGILILMAAIFLVLWGKQKKTGL